MSPLNAVHTAGAFFLVFTACSADQDQSAAVPVPSTPEPQAPVVSEGGGGQQAIQPPPVTGGIPITSEGGSVGEPTVDVPEPMELPPGVPEGYQLVYAQDFSSAQAVADFVFANPDEWGYSDQGYLENTEATYEPQYRSPHSIALLDSVRVSSFVLDLELQQTGMSPDPHRDLCVFFNFQSPTRFYYAHIAEQHDETAAHNIHIVNEAPRSPITEFFTAGYDWGQREWKSIRLTRDAATGDMQVFDLVSPDDPILTAKDTTFTSGYIGIGSFGDSGRVRHVQLWAPFAEQTPSDFEAPWAGLVAASQ